MMKITDVCACRILSFIISTTEKSAEHNDMVGPTWVALGWPCFNTAMNAILFVTLSFEVSAQLNGMTLTSLPVSNSKIRLAASGADKYTNHVRVKYYCDRKHIVVQVLGYSTLDRVPPKIVNPIIRVEMPHTQENEQNR
mmetsp:Transcript_5961/g.12259  ORF Transcript_5961/g.12259 Transcript_5961/m.12259 type:complete len:139 (+) Transcript_5961:1399-1815(+)